MILLTDEEIQKAWVNESLSDELQEDIRFHAMLVAKAQLKKVVEWGDEPCPHYKGLGRRECDQCWQSLLDEERNDR